MTEKYEISPEYMAGIRFGIEWAAKLADPIPLTPDVADHPISKAVNESRARLARDIRKLIEEFEHLASPRN